MTKLNDLQRILLAAAARRDDGSLLPPPDEVGERSSAIDKAIKSLVRRGLAAGLDTPDASQPLSPDHDPLVGARITAAGRTALGVEDKTSKDIARSDGAGSAPQVQPAPRTKTSQVLTMLERADGTTLDELVTATGWLPHTTRAALTGLRKKGHALTSEKIDGIRRYSIASVAEAGAAA